MSIQYVQDEGFAEAVLVSPWDGYRLIKAKQQYADAIATLHDELDPSPWSADQWAEALSKHPYAWMVLANEPSPALAQLRPLGYMIFRLVEDTAELLNFGIEASCQGVGLGRAVLSHAITTLTLDGQVKQVFLEVRQSNIPAISLYQRLGFKEVGRRKDYYPLAILGREDALVMRKILE